MKYFFPQPSEKTNGRSGIRGIRDPKGSFYSISPTKIEKAISWCINSTSNSTYAPKPEVLARSATAYLPVLRQTNHSLFSSYFKVGLGLFWFFSTPTPTPPHKKKLQRYADMPVQTRLNKHISAGNTGSNYSCNQHKPPQRMPGTSDDCPSPFAAPLALTRFRTISLIILRPYSLLINTSPDLETLIISDAKNSTDKVMMEENLKPVKHHEPSSI